MGLVEAASEETALGILDRKGWYVTFLQEERLGRFQVKSLSLFDNISDKDLMLFSRQLSIMFKARVPLLEALATIARQLTNRAFREKVFEVSEDVEGGMAFSRALARHPDVFSSFYVNMVKRGESLGNLSDVLGYLAEHLEREFNLKGKVRGAMVYPIFVLIVAAAVITLLTVLVLPGLTQVLEEGGQDLPAITRVVIAVSNVYGQWWWLITLLFLGAMIGAFRWAKTEQGKRFFNKLFLKIPVISRLLKMMYISRFGENLATMIAGGVHIVEALEIASKIVGNDVYEDIIREAKDSVAEGSHIADAFQKYPVYFPPVFTQMIMVGEQSGRLDSTLLDIVRFYQIELDRSVEAFLSLIEPLMIVALGVLVGGVMASLMLPLYQLSSTIGG